MRTGGWLLAAVIGTVSTMAVGLGSAAAESSDPQVRVAPNPVTQGDRTTAYGSGFCKPPRCSEVTIALDGEIVARGYADSHGRFARSFRADVEPGRHTVTASQRTNQGTQQASTGLVVRADNEPQRPHTTTATATSATTRTSTPTSSRPSSSPSSSTTASSSSSSAVVLTRPPLPSLRPMSLAPMTTSPPPSDILGLWHTKRTPHADYLGWIWWLLPAALATFLAIAYAAWRQRASRAGGTHRFRQ